MLKSVFIPNRTNSFAWANLLFLILLIAIGKITAYTVLFGYFFETIIIGIFNCFKIYRCSAHEKKSSIGTILFFCAHYGGFIAVQSIFLFSIFSFSGDGELFMEPFHLIDNYQIAIGFEGMHWMLLILFIGQLLKYYFDFLVPKKYTKFTGKEIMFKPYLRILIQQFVVILGGFFIILSEASIITAILLVIFRFITDFFLVAIREDSRVLDYLVDKMSETEEDKDEIRKQLLLFSE
ncbi:MAG: hypothetical protein ED556_10770 [Winogradskyella sp.]|uniref:DUF6498-containing protein n=1 Tax=Winogradskyella sp. TaxID=1883156 RepID=UPI000F3D1BAD|nr:DUF6498-containing protein [Winogradskyella sp.]RNC85044.1 MAG: hypothetical protein ED556_10770 [Winogradskyella sp.]